MQMDINAAKIHRTVCPGCAAKNEGNIKIMDRDFNFCADIVPFRYYSVYLCRTCKLVYAGDIEESMPLNRYYEKMSRYEGENFVVSPKLAKHYEFVASFITSGLKPDSRILDVGCAFGGLLYEFKKKGYRNVFGLEPSEKNCIYAAEKYGISVCHGQLGEENELSSEKFDVVILNGVLEHLMDIKERIQNCKSLLEDNGLLVLTVPDIAMFKEHDDLYQEFSAELINYFGIDSLGYIMHQEGFSLDNYKKDHASLMGLAGNMVSVWHRESDQSVYSNFDKADSERELELYMENCKRYRERIKQKADSYETTGGYYVWGAGTNTAMLVQSGILKKDMIRGVFDSNKNYQGCMAYGNKIEDPVALRDKESFPIVISSQYAFQAIKTRIDDMGLKNEVIDLFSL